MKPYSILSRIARTSPCERWRVKLPRLSTVALGRLLLTNNAKETQGGLCTSGGGNVDRGFGSLRYGGTIGMHADYRVFGNYFNRGSFEHLSGVDAADGWATKRSGFQPT